MPGGSPAFLWASVARQDESGEDEAAAGQRLGRDQLAQEKREIVKSGAVYQFSFAYDVLDWAPVELEDGTKANELREIELFEISIVPIPANQRAVMTEVKAGRRNSKKDADAIKEAITLLQGVLGELEGADDPEDGEDEAKANTAVEEPEQSNPEKDRLLDLIKAMQKEGKDEPEE